MIGDKIIITAKHKKIAKKICPDFMKNYKKGAKYILAIGGEAGSGKTEIAILLRDYFYENSIRTELIHIDDYYKTSWSKRNEIRQKTNVIGKKEIDWDKLNSVVNTFRSDFYNNLIIQRINKFTDSIEKAILDIKHIDVLIIEGLYALYLKDTDLKIYLEGTYKETEAFRLKRNKEPQNRFRIKVLKKEHLDVIKSKQYADITL